MGMLQIDRDRREFPRITIQRPCKLFDPRSGKYYAALSVDLSAGGVLIRLERPMHVDPGSSMFLGMAQKRRQALLRSEEMVEVKVVRTIRLTDGSCTLALRFAAGLQGLTDEPRRAA
jgi:c-di-GMP-binding flagellar brake protein YcgR